LVVDEEFSIFTVNINNINCIVNQNLLKKLKSSTMSDIHSIVTLQKIQLMTAACHWCVLYTAAVWIHVQQQSKMPSTVLQKSSIWRQVL